MFHLFKITANETALSIQIMGIKFKINHKHTINKRLCQKFIRHEVKPHTILLAELNSCHYETIPGYYHYLKELGYNVEIAIVGKNADAFEYVKPKPKIWCFYQNEILQVLENTAINKYERVIFNSKIFYNCQEHPEADIVKLFPNLQHGEKETVYVQHHIDRISEEPKCKQIILANPSKDKKLCKNVVNPHNFGNIRIKAKSDKIINFISVGALDINRRNIALLIEAVRTLHERGIKNFKITVVGMGKLRDLPKEIRGYFNVLGRISYKEMYKEMMKADYFLTLLDPDIKAHERYKKDGTSGSFQLIYGFLKPCLIHKIFADIYNFNAKNSIVYTENSALAEAMQKACSLSAEDYQKMQDTLSVDVSEIEKTSFKNLKDIIDD